MRKLLLMSLFISLVISLGLLPALAKAELYITIVQGLSGMPQYQEEFDAVREKIAAASVTLTTEERVFTFSGEAATREALLAHFAMLDERMTDDDRAALYLIGHGSFNGEIYKYNIPGTDLTHVDLKGILDTLPGQNHLLISTGSTSGALVEAITGVPAPREDRTADTEEAVPPSEYLLITATRNGNERNVTHFGRFFAEALVSSAADFNKNDTISVQEAFDYADREVAAYFESEGRLATEHAQLRGEGAAQFSLARLNVLDFDAGTPELAELLQQRLELDNEIESLQLLRNQFASNAEYLSALQALVLRSAELTERIEAAQQEQEAAQQEQQGAGGGTE